MNNTNSTAATTNPTSSVGGRDSSDNSAGDNSNANETEINEAHDNNLNGNEADEEDNNHNDNDDPSPSHYMEGYTPLTFNMNAFPMMDDDGSDSENDNNNNSIEDTNIMDGDVYANNGYYHMMGPPPRRLNGVKDRVLGFATLPHDHDDDEHEDDSASNNNTNDGSSSTQNNNEDAASGIDIPNDFHLLAEQALRGLEVEHLSTLERDMEGFNNDNTADTALPDAPSNNGEDTNLPIPLQQSTEFFEASFPNMPSCEQSPDTDSSNVAFAKGKEAVISASSEEQKTKPTALPKIHLKKEPTSAKHMDVNAIQNAMKSIRLKSPQLATTLDAGATSSFATSAAHTTTDSALNNILNSTTLAIEKSSRQQKLTSHPIIPSGPLAAFRRSTPKAQAASANLTRSATLADAVLRLWPLICFRRKMRSMYGLGGHLQANHPSSTPTLTIHIIGADGVECSSEELVRKSVGSFIRWLDTAVSSGVLSHEAHIDSVLVEFSGPNMPNMLVEKELDFLTGVNSKSTGGLISAKATFKLCEYHETTDSSDTTTTTASAAADLVIAFNAGIWGYDSWKPTITTMIGKAEDKSCSWRIGETLFVITAYTKEECEDDADVIAEVVEEAAKSSSKKNVGARQLWAPEINPFSSRLERPTASAPAGRKYYENGAWQAWLIGL